MFRLQAIVDSWRTPEELEPMLRAGVDCLQIRIREESTEKLVNYTKSLVELCRPIKAKVLVNGRVDVAVAAGADGVQVGRRGFRVPEVRQVKSDLFIGVSVHSIEEALVAQEDGADAITFGHVFQSGSHPGEPHRGVAELRRVVDAVEVPVISIGGISGDNVADVKDAGASGVAIIGALWGTEGSERLDVIRRIRTEMGL